MTSTGISWADFYLICFAVGFCFSFFSFVLGGPHTGHLHLPHFHGHPGGVHLPAAHVPAGHGPAVGGHGVAGHGAAGHGASTPDGGAAGSGLHADLGSGVSPFNFATLAAFLAWFGGTGYLLTRFSAIWVGFGLVVAVVAGLTGGGIVFLFLSRVLISSEETMDPADYEMVGVLGRICSPIREGGTGELIYSQAGTRRVCGARSDDGSAVVKGCEVVVTRWEKGIAYVRRWEEMAGDEEPTAGGR